MHDPYLEQVLITPMQLGDLLKSARRRSKLTQSVLASRLRLSQNRVSYLELHPEHISFEQLLTWCAVLGLNLRLNERPSPKSLVSAEW